jgi:hypothetical protein
VTATTARRRGLLAAVAAFLVEPAADGAISAPRLPWPLESRPAVAVIGLSPRCGTTTVARALGVELALRDPEGASIVTAAALAGGPIPLGAPAAARLGRALRRAVDVPMRPAGRLCLAEWAAHDAFPLVGAARGTAPLVLDVAEPSRSTLAASLADAVVVVGAPCGEPALAAMLSRSLTSVGPEPVVVLNRQGEGTQRWDGHCVLTLPDSRLGAQLAKAGREPHGVLAAAVSRLCDLIVPRA